MEIYLIGAGCGPGTLTNEGRETLGKAGLVIGSKRLMDELKSLFRPEARSFTEIIPERILARIRESETLPAEGVDLTAAVLFSGDCGFYSGAFRLSELFQKEDISCRIIPGISSVQLFSARIARPWQAWRLVSGHGRGLSVTSEMMHGKDTLFLTDRENSPKTICKALCAAGLDDTLITVGENLGLPDERIIKGTAKTLTEEDFAPLSVLLAEKVPVPIGFAGLCDHEMIRGDVPMTKQEVRAAVVCHLQPKPFETIWDVGAGTGSVSAALAQAARYGEVYAVECEADACRLIEDNRRKHAVWNLNIVERRAPEALWDLPVPDAVFIGGTNGKLEDILDVIIKKNPDARICISALLVETLGTAAAAFSARSIPFTVTEISVAVSAPVVGKHMMRAQNPVWLIERQL